MFALDGVLLMEELGGLVVGRASEVELASMLFLLLALAAASVDLGWRTALAAFEVLAVLFDFAEEPGWAMMSGDGASTKLDWLIVLVV